MLETKIERIKLQLAALETLKSEGKISTGSYNQQYSKLMNELDTQLGEYNKSSKLRRSKIERSRFDDDEYDD